MACQYEIQCGIHCRVSHHKVGAGISLLRVNDRDLHLHASVRDLHVNARALQIKSLML